MRHLVFAIVAMFGVTVPLVAQEPQSIDLRVLYVGAPATPRGQAYFKFLQRHFREPAVKERQGFDPRQAAGFDVVLLDWSQGERPDKPLSPLGPLQSWDKPTVLLGSAGLLLAQAWEIHGSIG